MITLHTRLLTRKTGACAGAEVKQRLVHGGTNPLPVSHTAREPGYCVGRLPRQHGGGTVDNLCAVRSTLAVRYGNCGTQYWLLQSPGACRSLLRLEPIEPFTQGAIGCL